MSVLTCKCPNCDAELTFRPQSQSFVCDYCGSSFTRQEIERLVPEQDNQPSENPQEDGEEAQSYQCPSCGAQILTTGTTAATYCYYCHNPVTLQGRVSGHWKPDLMIPFAVGEEQAKDRFLRWSRKNPFVDRRFFSQSQLEKLSGVYFPFWLASSQSSLSATATARQFRVWRVGDLEYTETSVYQLSRQGKLRINNYDMPALQRQETSLLEGILTYDYAKAVPFSPAYLSGFQAERRDREKEQLAARLREEQRQNAERLVRDTVGGFQGVSIQNCELSPVGEDWKYLLLPAWILTYQYRGKQYYFAMNGQNGDMNGALPISKGRLATLFGAVSGISLVLLTLGGYFLW